MIVYPHRIRLRGPWDCEPLERLPPTDEPLPAVRQMTMPCRWAEAGLPGFAGRLRFRRRFGYPGRIDADERVWLTFAGVAAAAEVALNGAVLGRRAEAEAPFEFEITSRLGPRNELVVIVEGPAGGGLWGEVALEVRRTAFLRKVRCWLARVGQGIKLNLAGEVAGVSSRPLELYALIEGQTVVYAGVEADPQGHPFHLAGEVPADVAERCRSVRVDLVDGAVIWYATEVPVS